ncbi:MAG: hypothetical protein OEV66_12115, partial [Spirochaetia bacterium]|nr:hypothetical protein [Spirochaetia bacterium]
IPTQAGMFNLEIVFPMFMALLTEKDSANNNVIKGAHMYFRGFSSPDYGTTVWPQIVSPAIFLVTYIQRASWKNDEIHLSLSPDTPQVNPSLQNIVWYNPFFDVNTGLLNRYAQFTWNSKIGQGGVISSSLTNPSMFFSYLELRPFSESRGDFARNWTLTPSLWTNVKRPKNPDLGAGLETRTGGIGNEFMQLKFLADAHVFSSKTITSEPLSYRFDTGTSFQLRTFGLYAGYIYKSNYHPYGPFLSPLYVSRSENDFPSTIKNHGILAKIIPGINSLFDFGLDTEIYPELPLNYSLRARLGIKWEKNFFNFAFIQENLTYFQDLLDRVPKDRFIELHFHYYLLPDTFLIEWRHVVSLRDTMSVKSFFSLMAYF